MTAPRLDKLINVLESKNYAVFRDTKQRGYDLNIVGIRSSSTMPNRFDDVLLVFWKEDGHWRLEAYPATTDPGLFWLGSRTGDRFGTAILKEGQYRSAYRIGFHRGQYEALVQQQPVTVIRDFDRDGQLDYNSGREQTGMFGINIHRAHPERELINVSAWSAGCQVVRSPVHFDSLMELCKRASQTYGNSFTYTLIHERDFAVSNDGHTAACS